MIIFKFCQSVLYSYSELCQSNCYDLRIKTNVSLIFKSKCLTSDMLSVDTLSEIVLTPCLICLIFFNPLESVSPVVVYRARLGRYRPVQHRFISLCSDVLIKIPIRWNPLKLEWYCEAESLEASRRKLLIKAICYFSLNYFL